MSVMAINLKSREDRWDALKRLPWGFPAEEVKRVEAVDGRQLSWNSEEVKTFVSKDALRMAKFAEKNNIDTVDHQYHTFSPHLTLGAVACAMSHRRAWLHVIEKGVPCLIAEDDVSHLAFDFARRLFSVVVNLPATTDLCLIYGTVAFV